jgi:hypothetical protein
MGSELAPDSVRSGWQFLHHPCLRSGGSRAPRALDEQLQADEARVCRQSAAWRGAGLAAVAAGPGRQIRRALRPSAHWPPGQPGSERFGMARRSCARRRWSTSRSRSCRSAAGRPIAMPSSPRGEVPACGAIGSQVRLDGMETWATASSRSPITTSFASWVRSFVTMRNPCCSPPPGTREPERNAAAHEGSVARRLNPTGSSMSHCAATRVPTAAGAGLASTRRTNEPRAACTARYRMV